jgi:hypothetical protein
MSIETRGFSLCQSGTDCSAHPTSCGISGLFPLLQSDRGVKVTTDLCLLLLLKMSRTGTRVPSLFMAWTGGQLYGIQFQLLLCFALYFLVFGCIFCAAIIILMKQISSRSLFNVPIIIRKHKNNFQLQKRSVLRELKRGNAERIRSRHENNKTIDPLHEMWA